MILARTDVGDLALTNVEGANFAATVAVPTPLFGLLPIPRGWVAVDASRGGETVRFVSAHLETLSPLVQAAQAAEILAGPANAPRPVVFVCDCNSSARGTGLDVTPTYGNLIAAGFTDAWAAKHPGALGFTCCQAGDLQNLPSILSERIDLVLFRGDDFRARHVDRVGAQPGDRTPSPVRLWPSDHAGVIATLERQ